MNTIRINNFCDFEDMGLDTYRCIKCGTVISSYEGIPMLVCKKILPAEEDILNNKTNLLCTESEVNSRYSICQSCQFFQQQTCTKCGCSIVRTIELNNKLLWRDQSCPINKW